MCENSVSLIGYKAIQLPIQHAQDCAIIKSLQELRPIY